MIVRQPLYVRQRYGSIASYVGLISGIVGLLILTPLLAVPAWPAEGAVGAAFLMPGLLLAACGFLAWRWLAPDPSQAPLTLQEGGVIVLLAWSIACAAAAVPLMMVEGLDVTQALFESVSGWTTTGLSVVDVSEAHPATLLWRSVMQLAGGAGLAIIMLAAITGGGGSSLSVAEGRAEQLVPNVRASARLVVRIYTSFVTLGVLSLRAAGMTWFDSFNHAFGALSTGGFSTRAQSIGAWNSPAIELVSIALMLLGNLNFLTAWLLVRGRFRLVAENGEIRLVVVALPTCVLLLFWCTCLPLYGDAPRAWRVAAFETVSALTTTGYSTVGYQDWDSFGVLVLVVLMLIGGAACSTAGGIKQSRVYVLFRSLVRELRRPFLPRTAVVDDSVREGEERVALTDARLRAVGTFLFLYLGAWLVGAAILAANGNGLRESLFEFASALGTVGLSLGITGPEAPRVVLWTEIVGMVLGRLEFFVVFASAAKLLRDAPFLMGRIPGARRSHEDGSPTRAPAPRDRLPGAP